MIIKIDPVHPDRAFDRCREIVNSGGVIAYPTDTFYGLGADPRNPEAVKKLFRIKGRPSEQPVLLLIADPGDVRDWVTEVPAAAAKLMERFWPGPLTLVLKAKQPVLGELTAGTGTIGLRVPAHERARSLLRFLGHALTGTSANLSGLPGCTTAAAVADGIGERIDCILDAGDTPGGLASTIVGFREGRIEVIREGAIPLSAITS